MIVRTKIIKAPGIYQIQSQINGKIYVGSAINLLKRNTEHFSDLVIKVRHNTYLQNHYNKYGKDDLLFSIIEFCPKEKLLEREQYWIDTLKPQFNLYPIAGSPLGTKWTEERKKKVSNLKKGKTLKPHSIETKLKISASLLGKTRSPFSKETKQKMREASTGNTNWLGKHHSEKTKQKMSNSMKNYWNFKYK